MLVHRRPLPRNLSVSPQQFAGTHLYTWVEWGTVRVKCLVWEHSTVSPARARTQTARSGVEHTKGNRAWRVREIIMSKILLVTLCLVQRISSVHIDFTSSQESYRWTNSTCTQYKVTFKKAKIIKSAIFNKSLHSCLIALIEVQLGFVHASCFYASH